MHETLEGWIKEYTELPLQNPFITTIILVGYYNMNGDHYPTFQVVDQLAKCKGQLSWLLTSKNQQNSSSIFQWE